LCSPNQSRDCITVLTTQKHHRIQHKINKTYTLIQQCGLPKWLDGSTVSISNDIDKLQKPRPIRTTDMGDRIALCPG
jgi:putative SOS response-associated peptidase YedK